jgi:hypothetical protein
VKFLILFPTVIAAISASGAIGDTPREIEDHYKLGGTPNENGSASFDSEGMKIRVRFNGGYCVEERFTSDRPLSAAFREQVLRDNASTSIWNYTRPPSSESGYFSATRSDGALRADYRQVQTKAAPESPNIVDVSYVLTVWKSL